MSDQGAAATDAPQATLWAVAATPALAADAVVDVLELPFARRQKARQRACGRSGRSYGLKLPRGTVLRGGDLLLGDDDLVVEVRAARETVSTIAATGALELARVAYHLGNRHVWLEVGDSYLRYLHDHVLDDMVTQLGAEVTVEEAPFEPEAGAYGGHAHAHHEH
jgi:urease accessory protein